MTQYLIFPTEQEALDRSHDAHVTDTVVKTVKERGVPEKDRAAEEARIRPEIQATIENEYVTQFRWATSVGEDGQTAVVIDGDEQLLTAAEQAALVPSLPEDNWPPPTPPGPPVNVDVPFVQQEVDILTCTMGNWKGEPTDYAYQWQSEGVVLGTDGNQYTITPADVGTVVECLLTATNSFGSTQVTSNAIVVTSASPARSSLKKGK